MKKLLIICAALFALVTSCTPIVKSTYYIKYEDGSTNYKSNLYIQMVVGNEITPDYTTNENLFLGVEKDAISWFESKLDNLEKKSLYESNNIPVLESTTATFSLIGYVPEGGQQTVKTRTVTFPENHIKME